MIFVLDKVFGWHCSMNRIHCKSKEKRFGKRNIQELEKITIQSSLST